MDLYQIYISSSLCDAILNYKMSAHLHNLFMDFPKRSVATSALEEIKHSAENYSFVLLEFPGNYIVKRCNWCTMLEQPFLSF